MAGATVAVVVGADVELDTEVEVGAAVLELLDGQAAATAESSHSNSWFARPSQASSILID